MERDGSRFTVEQRAQMRAAVWAARQAGMKQQQIATDMDISQATVSKWLAEFRMQRQEIKTAAQMIAARIRGEMVCCDIYQRFMDASAVEKKLLRQSTAEWHTICFHGEWAAQLALRQYP